jgi:hypothetical protein
VDAAVNDLAFDSSPFVSAVAGKAVLTTDASHREAGVVDLLLVVDRASETVRRDVATDVVLRSAAEDGWADVDELFALVDALEASVVIGARSSFDELRT